MLSGGNDYLSYSTRLFSIYLLWTLYIYWIHRLAHYKTKWNFLFYLHRDHHKLVLPQEIEAPTWYSYFFIRSTWKNTVDNFVSITLPLVILLFYDRSHGLPLFIYSYIYETFLADGILDHNVHIKGKICNIFAFGRFHINHHLNVKKNFSLYISIWDFVFKTADSNYEYSLEDIKKHYEN